MRRSADNRISSGKPPAPTISVGHPGRAYSKAGSETTRRFEDRKKTESIRHVPGSRFFHLPGLGGSVLLIGMDDGGTVKPVEGG